MGASLSEGCGYSFTPIESFKEVLSETEKNHIRKGIFFTKGEDNFNKD